ncbi:hypothetical protein J1786_21350 [Rahnella sp. L72c]|uniref:Uncharacterized protein n=1 Tax=Rahnella perminowiae TaxID=2816244 RepID=A0ABS6L692_9GAMM|nr:hypothetical protein [Rahnella perminowiae]MBU9837350.1 hypothetical protein [Rahnella perminowiae]
MTEKDKPTIPSQVQKGYSPLDLSSGDFSNSVITTEGFQPVAKDIPTRLIASGGYQPVSSGNNPTNVQPPKKR